MPIDRAEVRKVARLARLSLTEAEEERAVAQLGHVLEYVERLNQVDVSGVEPLSFAGDAEAPTAPGANDGQGLRADEPRPGLARERALQSAPQADGRAFLVPRILE